MKNTFITHSYKILSLVLIITMIISMLPATAFAEAEPDDNTYATSGVTASGTEDGDAPPDDEATPDDDGEEQDEEQDGEPDGEDENEPPADEETPEPPAAHSIVAFAPLTDSVAMQTVTVDATLADLTLPESLDATVSDGEAESAESIGGVTWATEPEFEAVTVGALEIIPAGTYVFTPTLPQGYALADGVALPVITVEVEPMGVKAATNYNNGLSTSTTLNNGDTLKGDISGTNTIITVTGTVTVTDRITIKGDVTISGGGTLKRNTFNENTLIKVDSGSSLTLDNITIDGNGDIVTGSFQPVQVNGTFIMQNGAVLQNNNVQYNGGGVTVFSGGTFYMNGGTISGNNAAQNGGGVYNDGGAFNMTGGTISGNTAAQNGGGVYNYSGGTFTMTGGTISGNTVANSGGGVHSNNNFKMSGGTISGNTATGDGGGCRVVNTFIVGGTAKITGNTKGVDANNVFMGLAHYITLGDGTTGVAAPNGMNVGVTKTGDSGVFVNSNANDGDEKYFKADATGKSVAREGVTLKIVDGAATQLFTPENVSVSAEGAVSWNPVTNATSYTIKVYKDTTIASAVTTVTGQTGTSYQLTNADIKDGITATGTNYHVTVTAIGGGAYTDSEESEKSVGALNVYKVTLTTSGLNTSAGDNVSFNGATIGTNTTITVYAIQGTTVEFTANAGSGRAVSITGDVMASGGITVDGNKSVTAAFMATTPPLGGMVSIVLNASDGTLTANTTSVTGGSGAFTYAWSGTGVTDSNAQTLASGKYDLGKTVTLTLTRADATGSLTATFTVYKVEVTPSGATGTDSVNIANPYGKVGDSVSIAYTLDSTGTQSNTLIYSGATANPAQVSTPGSGTSTYYISAGDMPAQSGTIGLKATFAHTDAPVTPTPPVISTASGPLAGGTVGTAYSVTLAASNSPTSWTVSSGALPSGLTLNNSGVISGTPTVANTFTFSVTATNNDGTSAAVQFSITVDKGAQAAPTGLVKTDETVAGANDGTITGVNVTMEYKKDGDAVYTAVTGTTITGLVPGTYLVRYAANTNYNAGADATIVIAGGAVPGMTDAQKVAADTAALTFDSIKGGNTAWNNITVNLTQPLPSIGANGSTITWSSDNTAVIANDGTVTRPEYSASDASVTVIFTATITSNGVSDTGTFYLIVKQKEQKQTDVVIKPDTPQADATGLDGLFTPDDDTFLSSNTGASIEYRLEIEQITAPAADVTLVEGQLAENTQVLYLDVSLWKEIAGAGASDGSTKLDNAASPITITITLPRSLWNKDPYTIIRVHDDGSGAKAETITPSYDSTLHTLTFTTDKFSTYAIAYTQTSPPNPPVPPTSPPSNGGSSSGGNNTTATASTAPTQWVDASDAKTLAKSATEQGADSVRTSSSGEAGIRKKALQTLGKSGLTYRHDTVADRAVQVRVYVDDPSAATKDILTSGYTSGANVDKTTAIINKWFSNDAAVIALDQQGDFGMNVRIAARVNLSGLDTSKLNFYSYNKATNKYKLIATEYRIDSKGYVHFSTVLGGSIIITDSPLTKIGADAEEDTEAYEPPMTGDGLENPTTGGDGTGMYIPPVKAQPQDFTVADSIIEAVADDGVLKLESNSIPAAVTGNAVGNVNSGGVLKINLDAPNVSDAAQESGKPSVGMIVVIAIAAFFVAMILWAVIPRKDDPLLSVEEYRKKQ